MQNTTITPAYLSIRDAAVYAACSTDTIRRMIARGQLRGYRFGSSIRIKLTDLERSAKPITNAAALRPSRARGEAGDDLV